MNSKERVYRRLEKKKVDKVPNLNIVMGLVAKCAGVSYREYVSDYKKLVEGNLICVEKFGIDSVSVISDPMREASALGAEISLPENGVPYSPVSLLSDPVDLSKIKFKDPHDSPRTLDRIKGIELLKEKVLDNYPVIGWVEGVLAESADLRGVNELMMDLAEDPPYLSELMDIVFRFQCSFIRSQIDAGADIIGIGNAVASLIGPSFYRNYAMEYDRRTVEYIRSLGAKSKLHICGNTSALREIIRDYVKPDIFDIDWMVDYAETINIFRSSSTSVNGNIDPVGIMLQGTTDDVTAAVSGCLNVCNDNSYISAGCEIPADTPFNNLVLMNDLLYL